jgi:hypothetical protein
VYDLRTRRIPNWVTLSVLAAGFTAHLPGNLDLWLACMALAAAWASLVPRHSITDGRSEQTHACNNGVLKIV